MRFAFVRIAELPLQALLRSDPELATAPLAISDGRPQTPSVIAVSAAAARIGVRVGLTVAQARAIAPEALVRLRSPELERSATSALEDLAASFSPRLEPRRPGEIALDVTDLGRLFDDERHIATALQLGARKLGFEAQVAIAGNRETARIAATVAGAEHGFVQVVPPGREAAFLARLPVELLEPDEDVLLTLRRWGVRAIGELASLPSSGVGLRLGHDGARLRRVARGEADDPLVPRPEPVIFEESTDFEWPVDNVEALLFVLQRLVEQLVQRLACRGLGAGDLELTLKLDRAFVDVAARAGAATDVRPIAVGAPTREPSTLLALCRVALESQPAPAPVTALSVRARAERTRAAQLGLFEPAGPSPDKLATLLARLSATVGADRVGAPALVDRHLPDAFAVEKFAPPKWQRPASATEHERSEARHRRDERTDACHRRDQRTDARRLALHAFRPPRRAEARLDRGRLRYLAADGIAGQVVNAAGPFRVRDGWWQAPILRDYFDIELSDGAIYRVFHDRCADVWHIDGCYE